MKKVLIFIIIITVIIFIISRQEAPVTPVSPSPAPSLTPSPTPETIKFDSSTDLNQELDKVNPQVLDSDFE